MLDFLAHNAGTIIISAALLAVVVLIIRNMRKKVKRGECASCDSCSQQGCCHSAIGAHKPDAK